MPSPSTLNAFRPPERIPKSIQSERLLLRQYRTQDAQEFSELLARSFSNHLEPWAPPIMRTEVEGGRRLAREHILNALDRWDDGLDYRFFIVLRATGKIVGQIGLTQMVRGVSQSCSIGYWIGLPFIRKGYATEALVLAMEFGFDVLNLHRITLWIATENKASLKIPPKLSMRFEGTAKDALFLGDIWRDTHIFAITKDEWQDKKAEFRQKFAT